jgi:EAL and modified HD-GYP domain-containing signal transduction protein
MDSGNVAVIPSDEEATLAVLANGIHAISQDIEPRKRIFINFSREILEKGYHRFLDRERFVIEVLESVRCDETFVELVRAIVADGYVLALDDYVGDPAFDPILGSVEFVKIDFLALRDDPKRLTTVIDRVAAAGKRILAEKVETDADIALCRARGIPLAQGFFFSRPQVVQTKILDANQAVKLSLLAEVARPDFDANKVKDIIGSDVSLAYKLLRYVNAARFYRGQPIETVDYAIKLLGRNALVSWLAVNLLAALGSSPRDRELAFASAVRGRFLALVGQHRPRPCHKEESICLVGLLSLLDAILGLPMAEALKNITIDPQMRLALLGLPSPSQPCLDLARDFERGGGRRTEALLRAMGVTREQAAAASLEAMAWAAEMFRAEAHDAP